MSVYMVRGQGNICCASVSRVLTRAYSSQTSHRGIGSLERLAEPARDNDFHGIQTGSIGHMRQSLLLVNFSLLLVLLLKLLPAWRRKRTLFAMGLILCSQAYLVSWYIQGYDISRIFRISIFALVIAQPVFFWLLANDIFDDGFRLRWWHLLIIGGKFVLAGLLWYGRPLAEIFSEIPAADIPRLIPNFFYSLGFVFHATVVILRTGNADLVESRRQARKLVLAGIGILILLAMLSAAVMRPLGYATVADNTSLLLMTLGSFSVAAWGEGYFRDLFYLPKPGPGAEADPQIMAQATEVMQKLELFRTEGLTITQLANSMKVPEYKLRKAINQGLGYRNFNEFLNTYRIQAAKKFLEKAENADYPLIHLALDLGYPSPAPFNRAFKEATGMTPGEYRRRCMQKG